MEISTKQLNYLVFLFKKSDIYGLLPMSNDKFYQDGVDSRCLIFEDMIKDISSSQANALIGDFLNNDYDNIKKILSSND